MKFHKILLMSKAQPLCTGAELKLRYSVLVEVEKKIASLLCHAKRDTKIVWPILGELVRSFIVNGSTVGLLRWGCVQGFPGGRVVKNLPANTGDTRETGPILGSGRSLREGNGCSPRGHRVKHDWVTKHPHTQSCLLYINLLSGNLMNFCGSFNVASGNLPEELLWFL